MKIDSLTIKIEKHENKKKAWIILVSVACIGTAFYGSLQKTDVLTQTIENDLFMENIEALGRGENGGGHRYPDLAGKPQSCTLYVYMKGGVTVGKGEGENPNYEGKAEYIKIKVEGIKDLCPREGNGCDPYSCQEIPY